MSVIEEKEEKKGLRQGNTCPKGAYLPKIICRVNKENRSLYVFQNF